MSEHTPGPWLVTRTRNGLRNVGPSHNCTIAALLMAPSSNVEANARLISAAPDLLSALSGLMTRLVFENGECNWSEFIMAQSAIVKSTNNQV